MTFSALGDTAVVVSLGTGIDERALPRVRALAAALTRDPPPGVVDVVPAYATVTVFYEPSRWAAGADQPYDAVCRLIRERARHLESDAKKNYSTPGQTIEVPVCYGGEFGPDLDEVARHAGVEAEAVVRLHRETTYLVHAIGFVPGFPYLGGLPKKIHAPRRATPRTSVPAGAVGIGGAQTGIYPLATPGGWQLIGRTPLALFRPAETPPALLGVGDRVRFRAISPEEFAAWK